jgi:ABC-type multidrug transport system fused ATPase/permease subunit
MPTVPTTRPLQSTRTLLLGIWSHLSRRRRIQLCLLLIVMLASGVAELLSLGAALPFLAVLNEPQQLWQQPLIQHLASRVRIASASQLIMPVTLMFASASLLAALVRLANLWLNARLAAAVGSDLSCEAYRRTLYQPYTVHIQRNSAAVITATTTQIELTVVALRALLQLITSVVVGVGLLAGLFVIDSAVAFGALVLFGTAYVLLAAKARGQLRSNGLKIAEASSHRLKALNEGLGAIRDVLLNGSQSIYLQIYREADRPQRQLQAENYFFGAFPRYVLEALAMVAIAILGGLLVLQRGTGLSVIPLLGTLALGFQRLLPALQQIYGGWAQLKGYNAAIQDVLTLLNQPLPLEVFGVKALPLREGIRLDRVSFSYEPHKTNVLQGLDLEILPGERIGLIGSSGSGKSTTLDLLMGLLLPSDGRVMVDGLDLHDLEHPERLAAWRTSIAHVPQSVYLADRSIAENIAFGVPRHQIDLGLVKQAAAQAQIASFIEESAQGYESHVGERGIRLSGGQRQRIGIARAIYKQARVLIFDEATSALDHETEESVMNAINGLSRDLTVILVAHRLTTVERCDRVIRLSQGLKVADGPPQQVLANSYH